MSLQIFFFLVLLILVVFLKVLLRTLFGDEMAVNFQELVGPFSPGMNVAVSCQALIGPFSPGMNVNETISSG